MRISDLSRYFRSEKLHCLLAAVMVISSFCPGAAYAQTLDMAGLCAGEARVIQSEYLKEDASEKAETFTPESGNNIVRISSASAFCDMAKNAGIEEYSKDKTFVLTDDIDLSGHPDLSVPAFFGTFDGKGHKISGLSYDKEGYASGLFRYVKQGAVIRNLVLNASISVSDDSLITGGICGINEGIISDCTFEGDIKGKNITGGIAAINEVPGTIMACANRATVQGYYFTGGICGKNYGVIAYSYNHGPINNDIEWLEGFDEEDPKAERMSAILSGGFSRDGEESYNLNKGIDTGGISGYSTGAVFQSGNYGDVGYEHSGYNVGGIVGRQAGFVSFCENGGNVYGRKDVGGIVGQMEPYLTLDELESLSDAIDKLHDLVEKSIDDMHDSSDVMKDDMKLLSDYAKNAVDAGDLLTTTGKDYLNNIGDAADSLQARVDYLTDAMPDILDDLDEANDSFHDTAKSLKKFMKEANVIGRLSDSELEELEKDRDELKDRRLRNLPDRYEAVKDMLSIIIPESVEASKDSKKNAKKIYNRLDDISDALHDTIEDTEEVFDHLNEMPKPEMPRLGEEFDFAREILRINLDAMSDTLSNMADHSDHTSDIVSDDLSDVNDQTNKVFHLFSDKLDRIGDFAKGDTDEVIKDVSEEDIEAIEQGRVDHCVNNGCVKGDIDIGGIGGSMCTDSEDPEENAAGNLDGGFSDKYLLRNIILECVNKGQIESKKDGAGGVVGYMAHGIVVRSESIGPVKSKEGSYAGGIAGQSFSIIKDSNAMSYLDAASYVGGIAGFGTTITGCSAIPVFEERNNRSGSIAGQIDAESDTHMQHLEVVSDNRYVNDSVGAIDYFSMAGVAENVSYDELVSVNSVSDEFKRLPVVFITIDEDDKTEIIGTARLPYGADLSALEFPVPPDIEEEKYVDWPLFEKDEKLTAPLAVKGQITEVQKTLDSEEKYPGTEHPAAFVSGNFTRNDSLSAEITNTSDGAVDYKILISGDRAKEVQSLRLYNPFEEYELFAVDESGKEYKLESEGKGSYAEYRGSYDYDRFRLKEKEKNIIGRIKSVFTGSNGDLQ